MTHVAVGQLRYRLRSADSARLMHRLGLPPLVGDENRQSLSRRVADIRDIHEDECSASWKIRLTRRLFAQIREFVSAASGVERLGVQPPGSTLVTHD